MFTGIIEEIGKISRIQRGAVSSKLTISGARIFEDIHIGDSIAVNGVCLTVTSFQGNFFTCDVMAETLRRSNLGVLAQGSSVNLERAMSANGRFGGHIVSGHIDGTGTIDSMIKEENAVWVKIIVADEIWKYIVWKGSIAIDGISLTVAKVEKGSFSVSVIPHTAKETILLDKNCGDTVNLECDIIGKYVEKLSSPYQTANSDGPLDGSFYKAKRLTVGSEEKIESKISREFLKENGF